MVVKFKHNLDYYLKLFDKRKQANDLLGALDAGRNAIKFAKTKIDRTSLNLLLGEVYFEMGLYTLSCEHYFRAIKVSETRAAAYFGVGRNLVFLNRFNQSLNYFEKALEWDFGGVFSEAIVEWINYIKSQINEKSKITKESLNFYEIKKCFVEKDFEKALQKVEYALKNAPNNNKLLILYAKCLFFLGDQSKSRQILKTVLCDEPNNVQARLCLCAICLIDEDLTSFSTNIERIDKSALNEFELLSLARLFCDAFQFDDAIECLKKLVVLKPYSTKTYLFLAICYHNKGEKEDALFNLAQARWIDFENATLMEFYKLINTSDEILSLSEFLPQNVQERKLKTLVEILGDTTFLTKFLKNENLEDEINWLVGTKNYEAGEMFFSVASNCKIKKVKNFCNKILLSVRPNLKQKFLLTKHILCSQQQKVVEMTANLTYRSFSFKLKRRLACVDLFRNSISSAWAYIQCFANNCSIMKRAMQLCEIVIEKGYLQKIDEKVFTCLMFCDYTEEEKRVCKFFNVDFGEVENVKQALNLI